MGRDERCHAWEGARHGKGCLYFFTSRLSLSLRSRPLRESHARGRVVHCPLRFLRWARCVMPVTLPPLCHTPCRQGLGRCPRRVAVPPAQDVRRRRGLPLGCVKKSASAQRQRQQQQQQQRKRGKRTRVGTQGGAACGEEGRGSKAAAPQAAEAAAAAAAAATAAACQATAAAR